jgi:hypothetical protein
MRPGRPVACQLYGIRQKISLTPRRATFSPAGLTIELPSQRSSPGILSGELDCGDDSRM